MAPVREGGMRDFLVRDISEEETGLVAELEARIFSDPWSSQGIRETFHQKNSLLLGVYEKEALAGYVIVYCVLDEGEIARIAVDVPYRRLGAAGKLFCELEARLCKMGITRILLDVRRGNKPAAAFYRKYGFETDGVRKNFYTDPVEDGVLMSRSLGR